MIGAYVGAFLLLSSILFICAVHSCITVSWGGQWGGRVSVGRFVGWTLTEFPPPPPSQLFPPVLQRLSRAIVRSRTRSTATAVLVVVLVFITAFINMVWGGDGGKGEIWAWGGGGPGRPLTPLPPLFPHHPTVLLQSGAAAGLRRPRPQCQPCRRGALRAARPQHLAGGPSRAVPPAGGGLRLP